MVTLIRVEPAQAESTGTITALDFRAAPGMISATVPAASPNIAFPSTPTSPAVRVRGGAPTVAIERRVRRIISPVSGIAIEKLGHAIEYLADEYAFEAAVIGSCIACEPALQAIQLLMSLNRQVYFECPIVAPLAQRIFSHLFPRNPAPNVYE